MEKQTNNIKIAAIVLCGYVAFALIAWSMLSGASAGFDETVRAAILGMRTGGLNAFFIPFAYSGNWFVVVPVCLALLLVPKTRFSFGVPVSASVLTAQIFYNVLKRCFQRPRPDWSLHLVREHGFSFPSGHSITSFMMFATLALLILYYYHKKGASLAIYRKNPRPAPLYCKSKGAAYALAWLCFLYIPLMGFARVYVGVHWPTDVLASWCLGTANLCWLGRLYFAKKTDGE